MLPDAPPLCPLERVAGIEPASQAWEACALPLDDTRAPLFLSDCPPPVNPHPHPHPTRIGARMAGNGPHSSQQAETLLSRLQRHWAHRSLANMVAHAGQHAVCAQGTLGLADLASMMDQVEVQRVLIIRQDARL